MKYTQIPSNTFQSIQLNAGILVDSFNPSTGTIGNLLGATTGGVNFTDTPSYTDFGDDIDNCPKNMKELKKLESREVAMSGTFVTLPPSTAKMLVAVGDVDAEDATHIIPRNELLQTDFKDLWWVGDYSDVNTGYQAGYIAIHLMNALNTAGFQIQSSDKAKGTFAFTFTGHYSMNAQDTVPYEMYIKQGESVEVPSINLSTHYLAMVEGDEITLSATVVPAGTTITWASSSGTVASVGTDGKVTALDAGSTIVSATITVDDVSYNDTCTVVVSEPTE